MTLRHAIRPALVLLAAAGLTACGAVESDPNQFETMARSVAEIPLDGPTNAAAAGATQKSGELRPALKVEVLTPHALWDARDADLRNAVQTAAPRLAAAAAPAMAEAASEQVAARVQQVRAQLRPAAQPAAVAGATVGAWSDGPRRACAGCWRWPSPCPRYSSSRTSRRAGPRGRASSGPVWAAGDGCASSSPSPPVPSPTRRGRRAVRCAGRAPPPLGRGPPPRLPSAPSSCFPGARPPAPGWARG